MNEGRVCPIVEKPDCLRFSGKYLGIFANDKGEGGRDPAERGSTFHHSSPFTTSLPATLWRWPNEVPIDGVPPDVTEVVETYNQWLQQSDLPKLLFYATPGHREKPYRHRCR